MQIKTASARDLCIEAVILRLARMRCPMSQFVDINKSIEINTWDGGYCVVMDGKPLAIVTLHSSVRFTIDVVEHL